jgi:hypothetical protein
LAYLKQRGVIQQADVSWVNCMARAVFVLSFFPEFTIYIIEGCFSIHGDFLLENREEVSDDEILGYMKESAHQNEIG